MVVRYAIVIVSPVAIDRPSEQFHMKTDRAFIQGIVRRTIAGLVGAFLWLTANAASAEEPLKLSYT